MREKKINKKLIITQKAKNDLENITDYYQHVTPKYIRKILIHLENAMGLLSDFPDKGKDIGFSRRVFSAEGYVIVYTIETEAVFIQAVFPQKADDKRFI